MAYEVEIWGWKEKEELEKVMIDYIRWMFSLDCTLRYLIMKKLLMDMEAQGRMGNKNKDI